MMIRYMKMAVSVCLALFVLYPIMADCSTTKADDKGLEIVREADRRASGFVDYMVTLTMRLQSRGSSETLRELHIKALEVQDDGDKGLVVFDTPKDVKGTAFLSYSHRVGDDDQWIYLPALKRVKRISSRNKASPFMGSEFSYEDMASQEIEKYRYTWLRNENHNGLDCFVIERYPIDKNNSGYARQVVLIDKEEYRVQKIDYYDRKNTLLKTMTAKQFKLYKGRFWEPLHVTMVNHQTGKSTVLEYKDYRFDSGLSERDFTKTGLRRAR